jgi:tRNA pseudouridine38-40 synthase
LDRTEKRAFVESLAGVFGETSFVLVAQNKGLTVAAVDDLRRRMRAAGATYKVAKNRLALRALDGTRFQGWQIQPEARTVQGELAAVIQRLAPHASPLTGAGRTDRGVHATGQVVHFDTAASRQAKDWVRGGNTLTHPGICIHWALARDDSFDARFSAIWRRYLYLMTDRSPRQALLRDRVAAVIGPLDAESMALAAQALIGEHDFSSFRAAGCQARHPVRTVQRIDVRRAGALLAVEVQANAFLQHMVRNIVGSLLEVGRGQREHSWMAEVLAERDRTRAGVAAPPEGLYLVEVGYPEQHDIPGTSASWPASWAGFC